MMLDFERRASVIFQGSVPAIDRRLKALTAEHAAKGLLASGATVKKAIAIFDEETTRALSQATDEMAKRIEDRGRAWDKAAEGISQALNNHLVDAQSILAKTFQLAGAAGDNAAARAADKLLDCVGKGLRAQLAQFRDGWTSPTPKPWKDRHPNWDRVIFVVIGAVVAAAVAYAVGLIR